MKKLMDLYRHKNEILNDAFDGIVVNIDLQRKKNGYKTFLLCGIEPAVGTTTIAINLAISLAVSGLKTVLVDVDMRKRDVFKRLNESVQRTILDYLTKKSDYEDIIYNTDWELLDYIPSSSSKGSPVGLLCSNRIEELFNKLNEDYDFIILDAPSLSSAVDSKILAAKSDAVCLVAAIDDSTKASLNQTKKELDSIEANTIGVIVNKVGKDEYRQFMKNFDYFKEGIYRKRLRRRV